MIIFIFIGIVWGVTNFMQEQTSKPGNNFIDLLKQPKWILSFGVNQLASIVFNISLGFEGIFNI